MVSSVSGCTSIRAARVWVCVLLCVLWRRFRSKEGERRHSEILRMFLSSCLRFERANPCSALGRSVFSLTPHLFWPLQNAAHCPTLWKWTHAAFLSINFRYIQAPKTFGANVLDSAHFWYQAVVFMSVLTAVSYNCIVKAPTTSYLITWWHLRQMCYLLGERWRLYVKLDSA